MRKRQMEGVENANWVIAIASVAHAVVQLDVAIVNVALQKISANLSADVSALQWLVNSYTLAFAVFLLSAGSIGDRIGSKLLFLVGCLVFAASSMACGLAPNIQLLNISRALQGLGAALLIPSSLALLRNICARDKELLARGVAIWAAVGGASFACGPVIGGVLLAAFGWRSIFLVNVPLCAFGAVLAYRYLRETPKSYQIEFDWLGQFLAALALLGLVGAAIEFHARGLRHPFVLGGLVCAIVTGGAFFYAEKKSTTPMLPMHLFRDARFSAPIIFGMIINATYCGVIFILSLYLQSVLEYSTMQAGLAFLPLTATFVVANLISGRMTASSGPRLPMLVGAAVAAIGYALLLPLSDKSTIYEMLPGFFLIPAGMGMTVPAILIATLSSVDQTWSGTASAVLTSARQVGVAIGVAVFGSLIGEGSKQGILSALHISVFFSALLLLVALGIAFYALPRVSETTA
jgi:MFS transporter, DHA2 family, methylenomycin A resistance protein